MKTKYFKNYLINYLFILIINIKYINCNNLINKRNIGHLNKQNNNKHYSTQTHLINNLIIPQQIFTSSSSLNNNFNYFTTNSPPLLHFSTLKTQIEITEQQQQNKQIEHYSQQNNNLIIQTSTLPQLLNNKQIPSNKLNIINQNTLSQQQNSFISITTTQHTFTKQNNFNEQFEQQISKPPQLTTKNFKIISSTNYPQQNIILKQENLNNKYTNIIPLINNSSLNNIKNEQNFNKNNSTNFQLNNKIGKENSQFNSSQNLILKEQKQNNYNTTNKLVNELTTTIINSKNNKLFQLLINSSSKPFEEKTIINNTSTIIPLNTQLNSPKNLSNNIKHLFNNFTLFNNITITTTTTKYLNNKLLNNIKNKEYNENKINNNTLINKEYNNSSLIDNKIKYNNLNKNQTIITKLIPTTTILTTTTKDPKIFKELEKAGAPEILKQIIPPKIEFINLNEISKKNIESNCENRKCLGQKKEFKEQKEFIVKQEQIIELKLNPNKNPLQIQNKIEQRISKTFQLKKELIKNAGLEDKIEPINNGVFQADLLLTEEQANLLIIELLKQQKREQLNRIKRAGNVIFTETKINKRWPLNTPIKYIFDQNIGISEQNQIKQSLIEIQSKTCLKFIETKTKPLETEGHLFYTKIANPTFCGLSYIGQVLPANPIYLSFMCGNETGIALHETLHSLGFQHEQLRSDRDQYINIKWENVNPQQLDFFAISDITKFTSYGLRYDYGSIMHYSNTIASKSPGKPTMTAKLSPFLNDQLMGQRKGLSNSDIEAINKIYCMEDCEDKLVYCGIWATFNLCNQQMWRRVVVYEWIINNCQKSCNKCEKNI